MKKIIYSAALLASLALGSCKREYLNINDNPNAAVSSTALLVLPAALNITAGRLMHNEVGAHWGGQISPTTNVTGFDPDRTYDAPSNWAQAGNLWISCYDNLQDYDFVEKDAATKGLKTVQGIAQVMKVYNFQILVDAYGDIPYKQALQANNSVISPVYDSAKDVIYPDFILKLDEALKNLRVVSGGDNASIGQEDIYFGGDRLKWIKFANTLKLRILMRQSGKPGKDLGKDQYIKDEITRIVSEGGGFLGKNENVLSNPGYVQTSQKQNQFWAAYAFSESGNVVTNSQFFAISRFARETIEGAAVGGTIAPPTDLQRVTRIMTFVPGTTNYSLTGVPFGAPNPTNNNFGYSLVSHLGAGILNKFNQPMVVMTACESLMLQAEARFRGLLVSGASYETLFKDGVISSFVLLKAGSTPLLTGTTPSVSGSADIYTDFSAILEDIDWGLINRSVFADLYDFDADESKATQAAMNYMNYSRNAGTIADIVTTTDKLKAIMHQKFIGTIGFGGFEMWCDVRRYQSVDGTPNLILDIPRSINASVVAGTTTRPLRFPYPAEEQRVNNTNLQAAVTKQGYTTSILTKGLFWDVD